MKYITITDPHGAIKMDTSEYVPISHRILFDGKEFHGYDSSIKLFPTYSHLISMLSTLVKQSLPLAEAYKTVGPLSIDVTTS